MVNSVLDCGSDCSSQSCVCAALGFLLVCGLVMLYIMNPSSVAILQSV